MKKTILIALAVLLAIVAVTCDSFAPDAVVKEPIQYTEDGRPLVQLTINAPKMSRALTEVLAKGGVDYYEVAFKDPNTTKIYRASWDYTKTGKIAIPPGNYSGAINAILFAGRYSDRTLLAVGLLTNVDTGSGTPAAPVTLIAPNTTTVTFTLGPLTNNVINSQTASTFKITAPTSPNDYSTANAPTPFPTGTIDGIKYPLFRIPKDTATGIIAATYTVNFPTIGTPDTKPGIIISGAGRLISSGEFFDKDKGVSVDGSITPIGGAVTGSFTLDIITTGLDTGLSRLSIEVPVIAISANDTPGTWYIRGGISQNILDAGVTANSLGGAVLLAVGPVTIDGITINPTWP